MSSGERRYFWLKLKKDFFKRHDITIIKKMENGHEFILFYLELLCESLDHDGRLRFSDEVPYSTKMLSVLYDISEDIVNQAIDIFKEFGLLEILDDGTIYMTKMTEKVGSESQGAIQKRRQKELPKLAGGCKRLNANMLRLPNGKVHYVDEKRYGGNGMLIISLAGGQCELCGSDEGLLIHHNNGYSNDLSDLFCLCQECHGKAHSGNKPTLVHKWADSFAGEGGNFLPENRDKSIDIYKPLSNDKGIESTTPTQIVELYAKSCPSFPAVKTISDARRKAINARLKVYGLEDFKKLFEKAEASSFLKGANDRNWTATFDWLIKDANMAKVLDGNYDDKPGRKKKGQQANNPFKDFKQNDYDYDELEKKLIRN